MENKGKSNDRSFPFLIFLWGFIKDNVYREAFSDKEKLKQVMSNFISKIKIQALHSVCSFFT